MAARVSIAHNLLYGTNKNLRSQAEWIASVAKTTAHIAREVLTLPENYNIKVRSLKQSGFQCKYALCTTTLDRASETTRFDAVELNVRMLEETKKLAPDDTHYGLTTASAHDQLRFVIEIICHELVHVEQMFTGKLRYMWNGKSWDTLWGDQLHKKTDPLQLLRAGRVSEYLDWPWEAEAWGRQSGLASYVLSRCAITTY